MYSILLPAPHKDEEEADRPLAIDPKLCMRLSAISLRDTQMPLEEPLLFQMGPLSLERDFHRVFNATDYLCSEHFMKLLTEASVPFIAYPAQILEVGTDHPIAARYSFWLPNWLRTEGIVDWERSTMHIDPETGITRIARLVLLNESLGTLPLLFQLGGDMLVHDTLRAILEVERIRGIVFASLETASNPYGAIKMLEMKRLLQEQPGDWMLWYDLSRVLTALSKYEEALDALDHVVALNAIYAEAWHQRGRTLHQMGRLPEALEALQQVIALDPLSWAWRERCQILQEQGRKEEVLACAEHLVEIKDKAYFSWLKLVKTHAALSHDEEALQAAAQAYRKGGSQQLEIAKIKGEILFRQGRYEEAVASYEYGIRAMGGTGRGIRALWAGKAQALHTLERAEEAEVAEQTLTKLEQRRAENMQRRPR